MKKVSFTKNKVPKWRMISYTPNKKSQYNIGTSPNISYKKSTYGPKIDIPELANEAGIQPQKEKAGFFDKVGGFMSAFETGELAYNLVRGEDPLKAIANAGKFATKGLTGGGTAGKHTYSDVLKELGVTGNDIVSKGVRNIGGTAMDIAFDPSTYLTVGESVLAKAGEKSPSVLKFAGKDITGKLPKLAELGARSYLEPLNVAGSGIKKAGKYIKPIADITEGVEKAVGHTFVPFYDLKKAGFEDIVDKLNSLDNKKKMIVADIVEKVKNMFMKDGKLPSHEQMVKIFDFADKGFGKDYDSLVKDSVKFGYMHPKLESVLKDKIKDDRVRDIYTRYITEIRPELENLAKSFGVDTDKLFDNYIYRGLKNKQKNLFGKGELKKVKPSQLKKRTALEYAGKDKDKDPLWAISKSLAELKVAKQTNDTIEEILTNVGIKKTKNLTPEDIMNLGDFVEYKPKGAFRMYPVLDDLGKVVGKGASSGETWLVPKEVGDVLNKRFGEKEVNEFIGLYDKLQNLWKGSVTSLFPSFHTRNEVNNIFMNTLAGNKNIKNYIEADKILKNKGGKISIRGKEMAVDELRDMARRTGVLNTGFYGNMLYGGADEIEKVLKKDGLSKFNPVNIGSNVGDYLENNARLSLFIDRLKKGDSVEDASKAVKKWLFDYSELTDIEKNVFKRVIPFYSFMRKNVPLQLSILGGAEKGKNVYRGMFKLYKNLNKDTLSPEEKALLPEWMTNTLDIPLGKDKNGNPKFLTSFGLGVEQLANLTPKDVANMMSPLIKTPLESMSGYSFFTDSPIKESSYFNRAYPSTLKIPGMSSFLQAKESTRPVYKNGSKTGETQRIITVNPERKHLLYSFLGRTINTLGKSTDERKTMVERIANALTGSKISTVDLAEQGYWKDKKMMEQLQDQLIQMGYLKKYESVYKPKTI